MSLGTIFRDEERLREEIKFKLRQQTKNVQSFNAVVPKLVDVGLLTTTEARKYVAASAEARTYTATSSPNGLPVVYSPYLQPGQVFLITDSANAAGFGAKYLLVPEGTAMSDVSVEPRPIIQVSPGKYAIQEDVEPKTLPKRPMRKFRSE